MRIIESSKSGQKWCEVKPILEIDGDTNIKIVKIDPEIKHQEFLGLGSDVTECTCQNIMRLAPTDQDKFIELLFDKEKGAGLNIIRDDIGSSDFTAGRYNLAVQFDDTQMTSFSLEREKIYTIPIINKIKKVNPNVFVLGSVWSPPEWMKDTKSMVGKGGILLKKYYPAFAKYLLNYVVGMTKLGVKIDALTIQNEPQADHGGLKSHKMPQCLYTPQQEAEFVRDHLFPLFKANNITTQIWGMDHNYDMLWYTDALINEAKSCYSAMAWHHYEGKVSTMRKAYDKYKMPQYFTEGQIKPWSDGKRVYGQTSLAEVFYNRAGCLINWITMLNSEGGPGEGVFIVRRNVHDAATFDLAIYNLKDGKVHYAPALYMMGHLGRYVERGAKAVQTNEALTNVAFENPDGSIVLYVENNEAGAKDTNFRIELNGKIYNARIPAYSVQTYLMPAGQLKNTLTKR